jgi:hypothetical protein
MAATTDPNLSYYQQVQANLGSSDQTTAIGAAEQASVAPQVAAAGLQFAGTEAQAGLVLPELQQQDAYQQQMAGYQLGQLGISSQQTGLQQQGTQQAFGFTQQQQQQQGQQEALSYQNQMQGLVGGLAASGALGTEGSKQQQKTAGQEYAWQQQTLQGQESLSAGDYARAQQNYALIGQANGLSQQEVQSRLQNAIATQGDSAQGNLDSLMAQAGTALSTATQDVGGALANAGLLAGINTTGALGG